MDKVYVRRPKDFAPVEQELRQAIGAAAQGRRRDLLGEIEAVDN